MGVVVNMQDFRIKRIKPLAEEIAQLRRDAEALMQSIPSLISYLDREQAVIRSHALIEKAVRLQDQLKELVNNGK